MIKGFTYLVWSVRPCKDNFTQIRFLCFKKGTLIVGAKNNVSLLPKKRKNLMVGPKVMGGFYPSLVESTIWFKQIDLKLELQFNSSAWDWLIFSFDNTIYLVMLLPMIFQRYYIPIQTNSNYIL